MKVRCTIFTLVSLSHFSPLVRVEIAEWWEDFADSSLLITDYVNEYRPIDGGVYIQRAILPDAEEGEVK